jgi:thymidylate kinase
LRQKEDIHLRIAILGPDGAGKSCVVRALIGKLGDGRHIVRMRHLKPRLVSLQPGKPATIVVDPHGKPQRSALISLAKILTWLMEEWFANLFHDRMDELLICDRYYHDLLIDPLRYRYGGPAWAARLIGNLMPQPDLWVLLDAPVDVLQARKQEVPPEETLRQRKAYRAFVQGQKSAVIVDADRSLDQVIADVECAITGKLKL